MIELSDREARQMFIMAFRYALGRKTYVVYDTVSLIIRNWGCFTEDEQRLFQREITAKIIAEKAGMDMDVRQWKQILELDINTK